MRDELLPATWTSLPLDALFEAITDGDHQPPPQVESGVPFLVIGNVRQGRLDFSDVRCVPTNYYSSLAAHRRPRFGDVLYTVTGSFGIPVLVTEERDFCVQRHIAILRPHKTTDGRYVVAALSTSAAFEQAKNAATGTAQKTVGLARLRKFTIPVAPLGEQQRIVEALDSYLSRLDSAVASLQKVEVKLKAYRASVLKAAVEGRLVPTEAALARREGRDYEPASVLLARILIERRRRWEEAELARMKKAGKTPKDDSWKKKYEEPEAPDTSKLPPLPEGWCWGSLGIIKEFSLYGPRFSSEDYTEDGVLVLRTSDISESGRVNLASPPRLQLSDDDYAKYEARKGDLLITRTGSLGTLAVLNDDVRAIPGAYLIQYRLAAPLETVWYCFHFLKSPGAQARLIGSGQGVGRPNLNAPTIESIPIPLPPLDEQRRIIEEIERLFSVSDMAKTRVEADAARSQRLRQSVLKWAFEGKLVDQDPNDEPAEKLLARIRAERATAPTTKTRGRKAKSS